MERMVRVWIDFEVELIGFANRLEGGCEKKRTQKWSQDFFILFYLNNWKNGFQHTELEQILEMKPKYSFQHVTFEMLSRHPSGHAKEGPGSMSLGSKREIGTRHLVMEKVRYCQYTEYIYSHWNRKITWGVCDKKRWGLKTEGTPIFREWGN